MAPLSSWYRRMELDRLANEAIARAIREAGADEAPPHRNSYLPGDSAALRGLPAVCVRGGHGGAIRGTDPLRELLRRTGQGRP